MLRPHDHPAHCISACVRRAVVVVGNEKGTVGVGTATAKEVIDAVQKAVSDAKKHFITVPLTRSSSFPHRFDGIFGAAKVMLRPAAEGTGVIAGAFSPFLFVLLPGTPLGFVVNCQSLTILSRPASVIDGCALLFSLHCRHLRRGHSDNAGLVAIKGHCCCFSFLRSMV